MIVGEFDRVLVTLGEGWLPDSIRCRLERSYGAVKAKLLTGGGYRAWRQIKMEKSYVSAKSFERGWKEREREREGRRVGYTGWNGDPSLRYRTETAWFFFRWKVKRVRIDRKHVGEGWIIWKVIKNFEGWKKMNVDCLARLRRLS